MRESSRTERGVSVTGHFGEGLVELVGDGLELLHLVDKLVFQSVDLLLELLDGLVGKLGSGLSLLQLGGESLDLLLVGLLPLVGLLLGDLQRLEVVGNNSQLLLQLQDLGLTSVCPLLGLLQV